MEYFLIKPNGEQTGTYSIEQVKTMLAAGYIGKDTRYWHEGITEWLPVSRIDESLKFVPAAPEPANTIPPQKVAAVLKAIPPPATRLEPSKKGKGKQRKPAGPSLPATPTSPAPTRSESPPLREEIPAGEVTTTPAVPVATQPAPAPPSKIPRLAERLLWVALGAVLMFAVLRGPAIAAYISDKLADKIVLTDANNFVLLDSATIKSFTQDMQSSPMVESLKNQIAQTTDPVALERLKIGMDNEISRHADEVQQQYLRANNALKVDPGTYRILAYYDDQGAVTKSRKDRALWVAIPYRDQTVYAPRPANLTQTTP